MYALYVFTIYYLVKNYHIFRVAKLNDFTYFENKIFITNIDTYYNNII